MEYKLFHNFVGFILLMILLRSFSITPTLLNRIFDSISKYIRNFLYIIITLNLVFKILFSLLRRVFQVNLGGLPIGFIGILISIGLLAIRKSSFMVKHHKSNAGISFDTWRKRMEVRTSIPLRIQCKFDTKNRRMYNLFLLYISTSNNMGIEIVANSCESVDATSLPVNPGQGLVYFMNPLSRFIISLSNRNLRMY